jgi:DNA polymerase elongation subunit (family B)
LARAAGILVPRKRLFFDIETSPNIGFFWQAGYDLKVTHECIIEERAIICICWKWEGQKRVYSLTWDWEKPEPDKKMLKEFIPELLKADEAVGHNGDHFDIPWLRTRCILYNIPLPPNITTIDTLKSARSKFRFNSNKLDYIGKYLGLGGKAEKGGFQTWIDVVLDNDQTALKRMVRYCKRDVELLEKIFNKMNPYIPAKTHIGSYVKDCPDCGSHNTKIHETKVSASGYKRQQRVCKDCGKYNTIALSRVEKEI